MSFKQTCDKPYDRHLYRVGPHTVEHWEQAVQLFYALKAPIEVLDKPRKGGGGF